MRLFFNTIILYVNKSYHDVWLNENINRQALHQGTKMRSLLKEASVWRDIILTPKNDRRWAWSLLDFQVLWVLLSIQILFMIEDLWIQSVDGFFMVSQLQTYKRWP